MTIRKGSRYGSSYLLIMVLLFACVVAVALFALKTGFHNATGSFKGSGHASMDIVSYGRRDCPEAPDTFEELNSLQASNREIRNWKSGLFLLAATLLHNIGHPPGSYSVSSEELCAEWNTGQIAFFLHQKDGMK